jgi:hypothetical protein
MVKEAESTVRVQMTFFDMTYKQFFGLTWKGPIRQTTENIRYDESVFFCSSFRDEHILCVIEIVEKQKNKTTSCCGWTAFRPFLAVNSEFNKRSTIYNYITKIY